MNDDLQAGSQTESTALVYTQRVYVNPMTGELYACPEPMSAGVNDDRIGGPGFSARVAAAIAKLRRDLAGESRAN